MKSKIFIFVAFLKIIFSNPFLLDIEKIDNPTEMDYKRLQQKLIDLYIKKYCEDFYIEEKKINTNLMDKELFLSRTLRAANAVIIDKEKNLFPSKKLKKINAGGDTCVVCCIPFNANYVDMLEQQIKGLENTGYQGFHLAFIGAYPNPTGNELKYAAVPYCFKIFSILEAAKLGFKKIIWLDAAYMPLKSINFIQKELELDGVFYTHLPPGGFKFRDGKDRIPNATKQLFIRLLGVDPCAVNYVVAAVMGFNVEDPLFEEMAKDYYKLVDLGTPFLSHNPEEFVLSAILGQPKFFRWYSKNNKKNYCNLKNQEFVSQRKNNNPLFLFLPHPSASIINSTRK